VAHAEIRQRDDRGVEVTLAQPASRVVTLAPYLAELVFAVGAGARLVGVSAFSDFPLEAARIPIVSDSAHVNLEEIVSVKPDLVLAWRTGNRLRDISAIEARGFPVFVTEPSRLEDVPRLLRTIGRLVGAESNSEVRASGIERRFAALRSRYSGKSEVRVFYEIWHEPLMTVNGSHYVSAMLALCGGRNVFEAALPLTPVISREQLLAVDPDAILVSAPPAQANEAIVGWTRWSTLSAVKRNALYAIDPALVSRMGARVAEGAEAICTALDAARSAIK
jgi:iron complex transport system substrate-binding protein